VADDSFIVALLFHRLLIIGKRGTTRALPNNHLMMEAFLARSRIGPGEAIALKIFFAFVELLIIYAGIYFIRNREPFFGSKGQEGDTYASANLRPAMLALIWVHSVIAGAIMIFEV
jgi:hypothetical protein